MAQRKSKRDGKRKPRQQELFRRGGKRHGAGRKPRGARAGERHQARPDFKPTHALHVVVRVAPAVGSLRRRKLYKAMRDATMTALRTLQASAVGGVAATGIDRAIYGAPSKE